MKRAGLIFISVFLLLCTLAFKNASLFLPVHSTDPGTPNSRAIITQMMKAIDNVKTLKYDLKVTERIDGVFKKYGSSIKLQRFPRKLYIYLKSAEVLWVEGKNNNDALVNPGTFPFINLNLNPFGSIMTSDQHHTIHEIGFDYFKGIIDYTIEEVGDEFEKYFLYEGEEKVNGHDAYKVTILHNEFAYIPYTVKRGETLITIARKLRISEYMIKENNKKIKNYHDVKEGQQIMIPNSYAKMTIVYLEKHNMLPLLTNVYDDKGLFESYEYLNLQVNPKIADEEFTRNYKDYHF